jgi:hypothetical protein
MFGRSTAEEIFLHWKSSSRVAKCTGDAIWNGEFQKFLGGKGFQPVIDKLISFARNHLDSKPGRQRVAEQTWKVVNKMHRRVSPEAGYELLQEIWAIEAIKDVLQEHEDDKDYKASGSTGKDAQAKINLARKTYLELRSIEFRETKKKVRLGKMLGKGGMGGAVYKGIGDDGKTYAVKVERGEYKKMTYSEKPYAQKMRLDDILKKMYEADVTTTCVDYTLIGPHRCYLLEMGQKVDWANLKLADIVSIFYDLHTLHKYTQNYTKVDLVQDVELVHLDIHPGNMMMFNGRLRLIDFGKSVIVASENIPQLKKTKLDDFASHHLGTVKEMLNVDGDSLNNYLNNWKSTLEKVNPEVLLCQGCKRQYARGSTMSECLACGSKNLVAAQLRDVDMESLARLKKVDVQTLKVDNPLKAMKLPEIRPEQYLCLVLTVNLLKSWIGISRKQVQHKGVGNLNSSVYSQARDALPDIKQKAPGSALLIEILLLWFDVMMNNLLTGKPFTAMDAVKYFDPAGNILSKLKGGLVKSIPKRGRSQSVSF